MSLLSEAMRLIQNRQAEKDNRRRGDESSRQREVEVLERIASRISSTECK